MRAKIDRGGAPFDDVGARRFVTSTPDISSGVISFQLKLLAPLALNSCCPLSMLELKGRPRTVMPVPSIWNAVLPPLVPLKREIDTPGTR